MCLRASHTFGKQKEHDMMNAKMTVGEFEISLTEEHISHFISDLTDDASHAELLDYLAKNTNNTSLLAAVINNDGVSDDTVKYLLENKTSDLCLWVDVINSNKVRELITEDQLIQLLSQSDTISSNVAYYIEGFEECDSVRISEWICENSSDATVKRLAENISAPNKVLKKLLEHENRLISEVAKKSLEY